MHETLARYGVSQTFLAVDESLPTGRAMIQLSESTADNSIVLLAGSNYSASASSRSSLPHLERGGEFTHVLVQNEIPFEATQEALRAAKRKVKKEHETTTTTILNPSPMLTNDELDRFEWDKLDWLVINEGEGRDLVDALSSNAKTTTPPTPPPSDEAGEILSRLRGTTQLAKLAGIVMTRGAQGVVASLRNGRVISSRAGTVRGGVKDTTGAGDCFTGFFATLLSTTTSSTTLGDDDDERIQTLTRILEIACQAAAMCCENHGAMESVPTLADVRERMGTRWLGGQPWESLLA